MGKNGIAHVKEKWSWERSVEVLEKNIKSVTDKIF